ncbi:MAG: tetratricopeptide repeat protein [Candidatus Omnitrophica bacterium]|nr:tetratricopeptide repeat protein [Candidatus Omnitrophota bacterium]
MISLLAKRLGLSLKAAFLAALIFGINPMKVESVAWLTERKDVLYALFYILALFQYWSYLKTKSIASYLGTLLLGFTSILAKPMALSLPLILFLLDWFEGRRWDWNVFLEKVPFFLYVVEIGSLSYLFNMRNPVTDMTQGILTWIWCFDFYIWKFLWPYHVSFLYPLPQPIALTNWPYAASVVMFISILASLIHWRSNRLLIFAFAYYFLSIFFILRFDTMREYSVVSDRFMYLPCLGFCLYIGAGLEQCLRSKILSILILMLLSFWGWQKFQQCRIWKSSITFQDELVRQYPLDFRPYYGRASAYRALGQNDLALADYSKAIELQPLRDDIYFYRGGTFFFGMGKYKEALGDVNRAIKLNPSNLEAHILRAMIEEKNNDFLSSIKDILFVQHLSGVSFADSIERLKKAAQMARGFSSVTAT